MSQTENDLARRLLFDSGKTQIEVADELGYNRRSIQRRFNKKRLASEASKFAITLSPSEVAKLVQASADFGIEPAQLLSSIVAMVIADNLFAAVLG